MRCVTYSNLFPMLQDSESEEEFIPQSLMNTSEEYRRLIRRYRSSNFPSNMRVTSHCYSHEFRLNAHLHCMCYVVNIYFYLQDVNTAVIFAPN